MDEVRFGIIGIGNMGSTYLYKTFGEGQVQGGRVSAVCDIDPSRLDGVREKLGDSIAYFSDYHEMLASGLIDAVMIETPHYIHPDIAIEALGRGIHTLCDKPAGVYTKQVEEMNEAARRSSAVFGIMFNQRMNGVYKRMREMIAEGAIGELQRVNWIITDWFRTQFYYDSGSWRATWDGEGGGVLINQCPHQLDLVSWIVGEMPEAVRGFCKYGKWHDVEIEDEVTAYFEYKCGADGVFITTTGETPGTNRLEISGSGGKLLAEGGKLIYTKNKIDGMEFLRTTDKLFGKPETERIEVECEACENMHAAIINNFIARILGKEELVAPGEEGVRGVELMNAIELSGWLGGERVTLPIDGERYLALLSEKRATSRAKTVRAVGPTCTEGSY
ncbi:MAG: Gfo/Idh/MocA family oxidoreductase [Clostridia bacterium]|nr:Gfo/Idh/MocA family oxidoreductase [Clostridia bacterium]